MCKSKTAQFKDKPLWCREEWPPFLVGLADGGGGGMFTGPTKQTIRAFQGAHQKKNEM